MLSDAMDLPKVKVGSCRCTYNTTGHSTATRIGSTGGDEMCNLYLMFYTLSAQVTVNFCSSSLEINFRTISWCAQMNRTPLWPASFPGDPGWNFLSYLSFTAAATLLCLLDRSWSIRQKVGWSLQDKLKGWSMTNLCDKYDKLIPIWSIYMIKLKGWSYQFGPFIWWV